MGAWIFGFGGGVVIGCGKGLWLWQCVCERSAIGGGDMVSGYSIINHRVSDGEVGREEIMHRTL